MHAPTGGDPYLEYIEALAAALAEREDDRVRDLLADPQATVLPRHVVEEAHEILQLPWPSRRAPILTLRHVAQVEEQLLEDADHAARRVRRRLVPRATLVGANLGDESDDARRLPDERQLELNLHLRRGRRAG